MLATGTAHLGSLSFEELLIQLKPGQALFAGDHHRIEHLEIIA
jgi:hypothetical protein